MASVIVLLAFSCALSILAAVGLVRLWRTEAVSRRMPSWWPYGGALWRGFTRAMPAGALGFWILIAAIVVGAFVPADETSFGLHAPVWYVVATVILFVGALVLQATIVLFNQPKFLVPPYMRDEPGALFEWIHRSSGPPRPRGVDGASRKGTDSS
jgi:hypothetical protein